METGTRETTAGGGTGLKRAANELMCETLLDVVAEQPFFCECDDPACLGAVWLSRRRYRELREQPGWRPLLAAHGASAHAA